MHECSFFEKLVSPFLVDQSNTLISSAQPYIYSFSHLLGSVMIVLSIALMVSVYRNLTCFAAFIHPFTWLWCDGLSPVQGIYTLVLCLPWSAFFVLFSPSLSFPRGNRLSCSMELFSSFLFVVSLKLLLSHTFILRPFSVINVPR